MWILFAAGSSFFAGITAILAKCGIRKTDSDVATAIRTVVVLLFAWLMVLVTGAWTASVFTDFGTVYIKQYRKCTATFDFHIISISFHNPIFCHYQITTENLSAIFLSNAFVSVSILLSVTFA